jgi:hypothetical protein
MTENLPPDNVVPLRAGSTVGSTIVDLATFEAEVVRRLEEEGYEDIARNVALGHQDKVFMINGSVEKGASYPGLPESMVVAIFSSAFGDNYVNGDTRVYIAPKDFNAEDRYLAITMNRTTTVLSMRAAVERDGFLDAIVDEWMTVFGPVEETEEEDGCVMDECEADVVYACTCQECKGEGFTSCGEHRAAIDPMHLSDMGRPAVWQKIAAPAIPS